MEFVYCGAVMLIRGMYLIVAGAAPLQPRNTAEKPPCFVTDIDQAETKMNLNVSLQVINGQVKNLKYLAESLISEMERRFFVGEMNNISFWNISSFVDSTEENTFFKNMCLNIISLLKSQRSHYDMLNGLTNYLDHVPQLLLEKKNSDFLPGLKSFQRNIFNCMCQMKIVLRSYHQDPTTKVPSGDLSSVFLQLVHGISNDQIISEYVVLLDSRRILNFLLSYYSKFSNSALICISEESVLIG